MKNSLNKIAQELGIRRKSVRTPYKGERQLKDYKGVYVFKRVVTEDVHYPQGTVIWYCDWRDHRILGNQLFTGHSTIISLKDLYKAIDKEINSFK